MKTFKNLHPNSKKVVDLEEIICIEADLNYSHLILSSGKRIILARTLKAYENDLSLPFLRVNRSCMINLNFLVKTPISGNNKIQMTDGKEYRISRRRIVSVFKAISTIIN